MTPSPDSLLYVSQLPTFPDPSAVPSIQAKMHKMKKSILFNIFIPQTLAEKNENGNQGVFMTIKNILRQTSFHKGEFQILHFVK